MSGYDPTQAAPNPYDPSSMGMVSQQPGMLGVSPSTWQSIAALGSGMVLGANQRTADGHLANGTGFAGGLAGGINGYLQNQNQQVQQRANLAHLGQETQGLGLQNQLAQSNLGVAQARNKLIQQYLQNPNLLGQTGGASPYGNGGVVSGPAGGGGPLAPVAAQLESGGRTNTPGIVGDGGAAAGPMQVHQGALTDVNRKLGTNYTLDQLAADPQLGTKVGNVYLQMQQNRFPGRPDLALAAYNAGPGATEHAVQSGGGVAALPPSTQSYVQHGMSLLNGVDPAGGLAMSQQLMQQANQVAWMQSLGLPVQGDPATFRQQANDWLHMALAAPTASSTEGAKLEQQLQFSPQIKKAEATAEASAKPQLDREGNMIIGDGQGGFINLGRGSKVEPVWDPASRTYVYGDVGGVGIGDTRNIGRSITPGNVNTAPSGEPSGTPVPQQAKPNELMKEFMEHRGEGLAKQFNETDEAAQAAKDSNYLFDNMRSDAQTWDMDQFAPSEAKARGFLVAGAHLLGIKDADMPDLTHPLADYTAFNKSSGQLLRAAVHDTSSRAAVQEYKLIGESLPQPTTNKEAFGQVADQWQGMNDFRLAKQQYQQNYKGDPEKFEVEFNSRVSPTAFMLHRMEQSPEGQATAQRLFQRMQQTQEGKLAIGRMLGSYNYAERNGLFPQ